MAAIDTLLTSLDERTIAKKIAIPHDEARMRYNLARNTAASFDEFSDTIAEYYNHHYTSCVSHGGRLSSSEAYARAKQLIEQAYRRRGGDIASAFNDCHDGTNGGMRAILDIIADGIKAEVIERYITDMFDRHVAPNSWNQQVEIIRQFMQVCGPAFSSSMKLQPEAYARDYSRLIRSYVEALQQTSSIFRRLS